MSKRKTTEIEKEFEFDPTLNRLPIAIGDAIYVTDMGRFMIPQFSRVFIERIIYGPDVVLLSNGKWRTISDAEFDKWMSINQNDYILPRVIAEIPRNPDNLYLDVPAEYLNKRGR